MLRPLTTHRSLFLFLSFLSISVSGTSAQQERVTPGEVLLRVRSAAAKPSILDTHDLQIISIEAVFDERSVRTKPTPASEMLIYRVSYASSHTPQEAAALLSRRPGVLYAQPNHVFHTLDRPNDPRFGEQPLDRIGWTALRNAFGPADRQVIVGIIDSGVDVTHEDLRDNIWVNSVEANGIAGVDDDGNGYVDDINGWDFTDAPRLPGKGDYIDPDNDVADESGHGTQVAGVAGAVTDNGIGVAGVADCLIMPIRAGLTFSQGGTFLQEDDLAAGVLYAVENGAEVLNFSWGSPERTFVLEDAIAVAIRHGLTIVVAAGNTSSQPVSFPASTDGVISVAAVDAENRLASFSSTGPRLDLVAPGVNILGVGLNSTYTVRSGTSFAAPHIAGLAAILLARHPSWTAEQVRGALVSTATDLGASGWDERYGAGLIDGAALGETFGGSGAVPPTLRITSPMNEAGAATTVDVTASATGPTTAYRLSWGRELSPTAWNLTASGSDATDVNHLITLPDNLGDTPVVLRLEVDLASGTIEDRVVIHARAQPPNIIALSTTPSLVGNRRLSSVHWITQTPTRGLLVIDELDGTEPDTLTSPVVHTAHEIEIPGPGRRIGFTVVAIGPTGRRTTSVRDTIVIDPARFTDIGFAEIARLPDGFLTDRPSDFDGDGRLELALMPYIEGQAFGPIELHEWTDDRTFEHTFTTTTGALPYSVGDVTGDGRPELLATTIAEIRVLSGLLAPDTERFARSAVLGLGFEDVDDDGIDDLLTRNPIQRGIQIVDGAAGSYTDRDFLPNPSSGTGIIGPRVVVADLDGDGRSEILTGDGDGDFWIYELDGVGGFGETWLQPGPDGSDASWVGGGQDLDGDGDVEFVVALANENPDNALNGAWIVQVWSAIDDDAFGIEWETRITGVLTPGNGIATGDIDGDGLADLALCILPDLYLIRSNGPNSYTPFWHTQVSLTHRPVIADFDRDNIPEIVFNAEGVIKVLERSGGVETTQRPEILSARPSANGTVVLAWTAAPEATAYRVHRLQNGDDRMVAEVLESTFIDSSLRIGVPVDYEVEALLAGGTSLRSGPVRVVPTSAPSITRVSLVDPYSLAVHFSETMARAIADPDAYTIDGLGHPNSALLDRARRRVVLTFTDSVRSDRSYRLDLGETVADTSGVRIDRAHFDFTLGPTAEAARADFDDSGDVGFSDFILFAAAFGTTDVGFDLDEDGLVGFADFLAFAALFGQTVG